jgi:hypothetical protein
MAGKMQWWLRMTKQNLYGVRDELEEAIFSGNKILQEKIEKGEANRYSQTEFNDRRKHSKKRDAEIKLSWKNAEEANKEWKECLKKEK